LPALRGSVFTSIMEKSIDRDAKPFGTATAKDMELDDVNTTHIAPKYQGTEEDKVHMKTLGRQQETQRVFTFVTMLGMCLGAGYALSMAET